jgi:hypothetical protein
VKLQKIIPGFVILAGLIIIACEEEKGANVATLTGNVYYLDDESNVIPVDGALVVARNLFAQDLTDVNGQYELQIETDSDELQVEVEASKVGFNLASQTVYAKKGEQSLVPDITLTRITSDTTILPSDSAYIDTTYSGPGAHIEVSGNHSSHVYVRSCGLIETAIIHFVVTDKQGRPVDGTNEVLVEYEILESPGGGEYLYPDTMTTQNGYAYTVLSSGFISGPVQIQASFEQGGQTYRTMPIRVAIYGGLPDDEHFSVALAQVNIAGQVHSGIIDYVTAFVGDKFSNPVAPGTVVYFSTDYGIVEGAAETDDMGRATVRYMSAEPRPPMPQISSLARITARSYGDTVGNNEISTYTDLLLSGPTDMISIAPQTFSYTELNQPVQFNFSVSDIWGYPVVENTNINVSATDGTLYGDVSIRMVDTQVSGPGTTDFQFTWAPGDSLEAPTVFITVRSNPPELGNGYRSVSISGNRAW